MRDGRPDAASRGRREGVPDDLVSVADEGFEAQADWENLGSPETYLGYEQAQNFVSASAAEFDEPQDLGVPDRLELNQWALSGNWTLGPGKSVLNEADGRLAFRFHARDVNLVMGPPRGHVRTVPRARRRRASRRRARPRRRRSRATERSTDRGSIS